MKPHTAPVSTPAIVAPMSGTGAGRSRRTSRAAVAPKAPRMNWPSTPMLNTLVRNATATARPVKISGVAATSVSVIGLMAAAIWRG